MAIQELNKYYIKNINMNVSSNHVETCCLFSKHLDRTIRDMMRHCGTKIKDFLHVNLFFGPLQLKLCFFFYILLL